MSVRSSTTFSETCSGAMYWGVPWTRFFLATDQAVPKSISFTCPV